MPDFIPSGSGQVPPGGSGSTARESTNPTEDNDVSEGYQVGAGWVNETDDTSWICVDNTAGAAVWLQTSNEDPEAVSALGGMTSHGFVVGDVVRVTGTFTWAKSQADSAANARVAGVVSEVLSADLFRVVISGRVSIPGAGFTPGLVYYLDGATAGALTSTEPALSRAIIHATSATSGSPPPCTRGPRSDGRLAPSLAPKPRPWRSAAPPSSSTESVRRPSESRSRASSLRDAPRQIGPRGVPARTHPSVRRPGGSPRPAR